MQMDLRARSFSAQAGSLHLTKAEVTGIFTELNEYVAPLMAKADSLGRLGIKLE